MLMNRKETFNWLISKRRLDDDAYISIDRKNIKDIHIPFRYEGIYSPIGIFTIWDEVGGIAASGIAWKPVEGGTVLFDVV